jgi:hypothetical protein
MALVSLRYPDALNANETAKQSRESEKARAMISTVDMANRVVPGLQPFVDCQDESPDSASFSCCQELSPDNALPFPRGKEEDLR